jgi:ABC-type molybdate transport system permease subunit
VTHRRVLPSRLPDVVAPVVGTFADAVGELGLLLALCAV